MNKPAVIYARYSPGPNQTEQSIEGQLRVCYDYAEREGYSVVSEYIDRAITGRSDDRPDFQRMLADAKKKHFQYVIVYKLDRFARNRYDSAIHKHSLKQHGVRVVSAMENIGDNPESIILEAILEASAEYYSVDLSQKIKRGRHDAAKNGKHIGGGLPWGYKSVEGEVMLDERKRPYWKQALEQYADGVPKKDVIGAINDAGFRNRNGKPFGLTAFQKGFISPINIGVLKQGEFIHECPAVISEETFKKILERNKLNKRIGGRNKAKVEYVLSGKLFCGYCGSAMLGVPGKGRHGGIFHYYSCGGRRRHNGCKKKHEKKDFIEWYIVEQTIEYVLTPARMKSIAAAVVAEYDKEFNNSKIKELERMIAKLDRDIEKYVEMLLEAPKAARVKINEKIELFDQQKTDLEIDLTKLRIATGIRYTEEDIMAWLKQFCKGDLFDESFRRRIIDVFVNSVYLYDDRTVVFYNIRGGKQVSYMEMIDATEQLELEIEETNPESGVRMVNDLMEARGVEPLSENIATQASTGVVTVLMSPKQRPVTGFRSGQPDYLLPSTPGGDQTSYPTKVGPLSRHMGDAG